MAVSAEATGSGDQFCCLHRRGSGRGWPEQAMAVIGPALCCSWWTRDRPPASGTRQRETLPLGDSPQAGGAGGELVRLC